MQYEVHKMKTCTSIYPFTVRNGIFYTNSGIYTVDEDETGAYLEDSETGEFLHIDSVIYDEFDNPYEIKVS